MAKYGKKASEKVEKAMHERKKGTLKSGSGKKVKSRKQAIAIGLSQARRAGGTVPRKKATSKKVDGKGAISASPIIAHYDNGPDHCYCRCPLAE